MHIDPHSDSAPISVSISIKSRILKALIISTLLCCQSFNSYGQSFRWSKHVSSSFEDYTCGITADEKGNFYIIGKFYGTIFFDSAGYTKSYTSDGGPPDVYIAKYTGAGNLVWVNTISGPSHDGGFFSSLKVVYDNNGNIYATGAFDGGTTFSTTSGIAQSLTGSGLSDIFFCKYDTSGVLQWTLKAGGTGSDEGTCLSMDKAGNIVVGGYFSATVTWNSTIGAPITLTSSGDNDLFVAKYKPSGELIWVKKAVGTGLEHVRGITTDKNNNIYISAVFGAYGNYSTTFGTKTIYNSGGNGGCVAKMDSAGNWLWVNGMGAIDSEGGNTCLVNDSGDVFFIGHFTGTTSLTSSFPGTSVSLTSGSGLYSTVVAKYNSAGILIWAKSNIEPTFTVEACFTNKGNIVIVGTFYGTANFSGKSLTSFGREDIFICELDNNGNVLNVIQGGGVGDDVGTDLASDLCGNMYLSGYFTNQATFGSTTLTGLGDKESLFAKIYMGKSISLESSPVTIPSTICSTDSVILIYKDSLGSNLKWLKNGVVINGETNDTLVVKSSGNYRILVPIECGETDTSNNLILNFSAPINTSAGSDSTICLGDSMRLNASGATSYRWKADPGLADSTVRNPYVKPTSKNTYYVWGTTNGCGAWDSVEITVTTTIPVSAGPDSTICLGDSLKLLATGAQSYLWDPDISLQNASIANPYAKPTDTIMYRVTGTRAGCTGKDSVWVNVKKITASAGPTQTICLHDSIQLNATGGSSYSWSPSSSLSNLSVANPFAKPVDTVKYYVSITHLGCSVVDSVQINVRKINADAGADNFICKGDSVQLNASGGTSYTWQNDATLSSLAVANPYAKPPTSTTYYVTINDAICNETDSVKVTIQPTPTVNLGPDTVICSNDIITFMPNVTNANIYSWQPAALVDNATTLAPSTILVSGSQLYTLTATNNLSGCSNSDQILVTSQKPKALFSLDDTSNAKIPFVVTPNNMSYPLPLSYQWEILDTVPFYYTSAEPTHTFLSPGTFRILLSVTDNKGCLDTMSTMITISKQVVVVNIPTAFTPNGDGLNDLFIIHYPQGSILGLKGSIWNRWGCMVYEFGSPDYKWWDGKIDNQEASSDVYFFIVELIGLDGEVVKQNGTFTLLR